MKGNDQENNKDGSNNGPSHIDSIPFDVMMDILTRLPVKSLLELQYVSKTWRSIIRSNDFINLLVSMSSTQSSRFLIYFKNGRLTDKNAENRMFFFTSSQEEDEFSSLVTNLDMTMASMDAYFYTRSTGSVNGFICLSHKGRFMICNPSTKQVITLPEIKITGTNWNSAYKYLGYDPVNHQYKAMRKKVSNFEDDQEHMVLTLGDDHEVIQLFLEPRKVSIFIPGSIIVDASLLSIISGDSEPWDCKCDHNTGGNGALENQLEAEIFGENNFVDRHVPPIKVVDGKNFPKPLVFPWIM
ncbi:F-box associated interaction domain [Arabidopsis suecica]|uniref:F-box associated interaction domain n=1 Tax=Arabidopsis suecica TaxID=45249 RepID=A0A8T2CMJ6_ARASU|nr:F-box associated interaction domain [Arabidopsis suecica]